MKITVDLLRKIFNVKLPGLYISEVGVYGTDMPSRIMYYQLKKSFMKRACDRRHSSVSRCISHLVVPWHFTQLYVTIYNDWRLGPSTINVKHTGVPAHCQILENNVTPEWENERYFGQHRTIMIFDTYEECMNYCVEYNQKQLFYGLPVVSQFCKRSIDFFKDYDMALHIIANYYLNRDAT